jgi:glycosyltransferase involved in cell wall biosynthesis
MQTSRPLISIITAVDPSRMDFFPETIASIIEARTFSPDFEWIVQVDGESADCAKEALRASAKIQANLVHCGPGATRNFALDRARGMYVRNLDADDVLLPQALVDLTSFLQRYDFPAWIVTAVDDMEVGKPTIKGKGLVQKPIIPAKELVRLWTDNLPVHPTTLCIQKILAFLWPFRHCTTEVTWQPRRYSIDALKFKCLQLKLGESLGIPLKLDMH